MATSVLPYKQSEWTLEVKPLTVSNYSTWKRNMETVLRDADLWYLIEKSSVKSNNKNATWRKNNKWAKELIKENIAESFIDSFHEMTKQKNAKQMWEALASYEFQDKSSATLDNIKKKTKSELKTEQDNSSATLDNIKQKTKSELETGQDNSSGTLDNIKKKTKSELETEQGSVAKLINYLVGQKHLDPIKEKTLDLLNNLTNNPMSNATTGVSNDGSVAKLTDFFVGQDHPDSINHPVSIQEKTLDVLNNLTNNLNSNATTVVSNEGAIAKLTDIITEQNNPLSLKEKALNLLQKLGKAMTAENVAKFIEVAGILFLFAPGDPTAKLCWEIVAAVCMNASSWLHLFKEKTWEKFLTLCVNMTSDITPYALQKAGYNALAKMFHHTHTMIRVFDRLSAPLQKKFIGASLYIIKEASDMTVSVVSNCISVLNQVKDWTFACAVLKEKTSAVLGSLFNLLTNGVNYQKECMKDCLQLMRSFGEPIVKKFVADNRNVLDKVALVKKFKEWQLDEASYFGDLPVWFMRNVCMVLNETLEMMGNFYDEHPIVTAGIAALGVGILGSFFLGGNRSRR